MERNLEGSSPVAIGGVGGSGTRVVAQMLRVMGFYMGADVNAAVDNLWFALLFKRPRWLVRNMGQGGGSILRGLRIFEEAMTGRLGPHPAELAFILRAALEIALVGHDHLGSGRGMWPLHRAASLIRSRRIPLSKYAAWGWKDPNSHISIEYLSQHFAGLKYILVVRHGLDMAYSSNQAQLYNWGPSLFDVTIPDAARLLPKASLSFWIKANERAIALGQRLLGERFLPLRFDDLCRTPRPEVEKLVDFLGVDGSAVDMERLVGSPKVPPTTGRYRGEDLSIFDQAEVEAVRRLGFVVEV